MLSNLLYRFDLWLYQFDEVDESTDIITALLRFNNSFRRNDRTCVRQLVPVVRAIGVKRVLKAKEAIFAWIVKQVEYRKELEGNVYRKRIPEYWHIGFALQRNNRNPNAQLRVPPDILQVLGAFHGADNYFVADEMNFDFAPNISVEDQERILAQKKHWDRRLRIIFD